MAFELDRALEVVNHYSRATRVTTTIIDSSGKLLYRTGDLDNNFDFCNISRKIMGREDEYCENVHLYGGYQAERFGGRYIFFCPLGLTHWASPILSDGAVRAYLLAGPTLMVSHEDFLVEDLLKKQCLDKKHAESLRDALYKLQVIEPDRVTSLSELLFMAASYISGEEYSEYVYKTRFHDHHSDISEYIHSIKLDKEQEESLANYPFEKEKELLASIALGDKESSQEILNEILGHIFFSSGGDFDTIKARVLELIVLLSRASMEGGADVEEIFGLNYQYLNAINNFKTVEELSFWLSKIMKRFTDCVFLLKDIKHVDVIYKAINYINANYMNKINLEEVADHVYLNSSYFSKVFKDDMKCNFNTYVNKVRVEKSKELLLNEDINLVDISNLVGYEDQSYFSKVFKRIVGVTPGRYRSSRGQHKFKEA